MEEVLKIPVEGDQYINAVIRTPDKRTTWTNYGVIITHGAGGDMNSKQIIALVNQLHSAGISGFRRPKSRVRYSHFLASVFRLALYKFREISKKHS